MRYTLLLSSFLSRQEGRKGLRVNVLCQDISSWWSGWECLAPEPSLLADAEFIAPHLNCESIHATTQPGKGNGGNSREWSFVLEPAGAHG